MKMSCCTMHNSTSSIYQGKQHSVSWRVCSGCLEMLEVKHSDLFMSHDTEKVAPILVSMISVVIRNLVVSHSTIQANGGWQHRMKIGHIYNFLCNKNLFCTPLLVLILSKFNFILKEYQIRF